MAIVDGSVTADVKAYLASNPVAIDLKNVELKVVITLKWLWTEGS